VKNLPLLTRNRDMNSGSVAWDVGTLLETNESVEGMLQVIGEKNHNDSGTFWCWDGRVSLSKCPELELILKICRITPGKPLKRDVGDSM
jgi:hypothetical protein